MPDLTRSQALPGNGCHSCSASQALRRIGGRASGSTLPGRAWERVTKCPMPNVQ
jgi:hypothetical protein